VSTEKFLHERFACLEELVAYKFYHTISWKGRGNPVCGPGGNEIRFFPIKDLWIAYISGMALLL
jgi:hypothetical protein